MCLSKTGGGNNRAPWRMIFATRVRHHPIVIPKHVNLRTLCAMVNPCEAFALSVVTRKAYGLFTIADFSAALIKALPLTVKGVRGP